MRKKNWNPQKYDGELMDASMARLKKCANVVKDKAKSNLLRQMGRGWGSPKKHKFNITRGVYKMAYSKGKYHNTGANWTARTAGSLIKTIRVTEQHERFNTNLVGEFRNVRIYAGNYLVMYAKIFEYYRPYMRTALNASKPKIRQILLNG